MYTDALRRMASKGRTAATVVVNFHRQRVLPRMESGLPLFRLTSEAPSEGSRMTAEQISREIAAQRAVRMVVSPPANLEDIWRIKMRPEKGYIQLVSVKS